MEDNDYEHKRSTNNNPKLILDLGYLPLGFNGAYYHSKLGLECNIDFIDNKIIITNIKYKNENKK